MTDRSGRDGGRVIPFPGRAASGQRQGDASRRRPSDEAGPAADLLAGGRSIATDSGALGGRPRRQRTDRTFQLNVRVAREDLERLLRIVESTGWTQAATVSAALSALEGMILEASGEVPDERPDD